MTDELLIDEDASHDPLLALMISRGEDIGDEVRSYNFNGCSRRATVEQERTNTSAGACEMDTKKFVSFQ